MARAPRRLAAIVAADVAGYSRLVGADEEGTLGRLRAIRSELVDPLLAEHGGRIANTAGDSLLLEFPSVVDAVRCAVDAQRAMLERNVDVPGDRRIEFRVGISLGDIVADGDDIHGDGVNLAARLEGFAEPGGIAPSAAAYEQVRGRIDVDFEDAGPQQFKNIDRPVQVWRWRRYTARQLAEMVTDGAAELPLPDKPSVAVLPFANMSADPEQDYFADGITEDIITELSRFRNLLVIARNSTFIYKGKAVDVAQVGRELGVRFVLEGSVRKVGNRIRLTAQLIEAATKAHLWAERYDRDLDDIFAVQEDLTRQVVASVSPMLNLPTRTPRYRESGAIPRRRNWRRWPCTTPSALGARAARTRSPLP